LEALEAEAGLNYTTMYDRASDPAIDDADDDDDSDAEGDDADDDDDDADDDDNDADDDDDDDDAEVDDECGALECLRSYSNHSGRWRVYGHWEGGKTV
jgi:hypothetical protein